MTLPSLSNSSTVVFGSVVTVIGVWVPALPAISVLNVGTIGGVVSVAF